MAQNLMRPLRSDSLKPRPSTQAVWEPGKMAAPSAVPVMQPRGWNPPIENKPLEPVAPAPAPMPEPEPMPEPPVVIPPEPEPPVVIQPEPEPEPIPEPQAVIQPEPEPETEPQKEEIIPPAEEMPAPVEEEPLPGPQTFLFQTFAPEVAGQPQPVYEEPVYAEPEEPPMEEAFAPAEEEEPFDLDAVIAAILAEDDEDEEAEEDLPAVKDAVASEEMPAPAFVPLYEDAAPKRKKKGWLWLILVVLLAGAAFAAWHFGWLKGILP